VVGGESIKLHLAGIPRFKADEVVLFSSTNGEKVQKIMDSLKEMGISYRIVTIGNDYLSAYKKANEEAAASFIDDSFIALNMSTGSNLILSGIEDGVRIQLYHFHKRSFHGSSCSAFRYFIKEGKRYVLSVAPLWNIYIEMHNDIFEMLADAKEPVSMNRIWEFLCDTKTDLEGFESFRKVFRDFKRWFKCLPCFIERVHKSPQYKIEL
jgi:hypothetical protein